MSGNTERVVINTENNGEGTIPVCTNCGHREWYCQQNVIHYHDMWQDEEGYTFMADCHDHDYGAGFVGWWCNNCGRAAMYDQIPILDGLSTEAEWP